MKPEMKPCPTITLYGCKTDEERERGVGLASGFVREYATYPNHDCIYAPISAASGCYYVTCTKTGNVSVWKS